MKTKGKGREPVSALEAERGGGRHRLVRVRGGLSELEL